MAGLINESASKRFLIEKIPEIIGKKKWGGQTFTINTKYACLDFAYGILKTSSCLLLFRRWQLYWGTIPYLRQNKGKDYQMRSPSRPKIRNFDQEGLSDC